MISQDNISWIMVITNTCMPRRAKMKMKRKRSNKRERMEEMAFINATTRFLKDDQYLMFRGVKAISLKV